MEFCKNCGALLPPEGPCCPHCGAARPAPQTSPDPAPSAGPAASPPPAGPAPQQPPQAFYQRVNTPPPEPPLTTLQYLGCLLLFCIPFVGLVFMLVWGFGNPESAARKRLARAALLKCCLLTLIAAAIVVYSTFNYMSGHQSHGHSFFAQDPYAYNMPYTGDSSPFGDALHV